MDHEIETRFTDHGGQRLFLSTDFHEFTFLLLPKHTIKRKFYQGVNYYVFFNSLG